MDPEDLDLNRRRLLATGALALGSGCAGMPGDPGFEGDAGDGTGAENSEDGPSVEQRTAEVDPDVDPPYNGQFVRSGHPIDNLETVDHWTTWAGGEVQADPDVRFSGTRSLGFEGSGYSVAVGRYLADPVDLTDADLSLAANFEEPPDGVRLFYVAAEAPNSDNQLVWRGQYTAANVRWQRHDLAPFDVEGDPDLSDVRRLKVIVNAPEDELPVSFNVDDLRAHPRPDRGKLIFRFDDCHAIHREEYFPVLEEHGYPGVEAVTRASVSVNKENRLSVVELLELQDAGWDLANHMTARRNVASLSEDELRADVQEMNDWFEEYDIERGTNVFVYPYGTYDETSLRVISEHFDLGLALGDTTNYSLSNPMTVPSYPAEAGIDPTKDRIDRVAEYSSLGILQFGAQYDREEFEEIVEYVAERDDRIDVITATDLVDHVGSLA